MMFTDSDDSDHLDLQESLPGEQRRAKASKEDDTEGGNLKEVCKRESKEERETHTVKKEKPKHKKERDGERRKDKVKHKRTNERDGERRKDADKHEITEDSEIHAVKKDNNSTGMTDRDKHPQEGKKAKDEDRRTDKRKHEGKQDDEIYTARKKKRKHERLEEDRDVYKEKHKKKEDRDRSKKRQHKYKKERKEKGDRDRCKEKDKHLHQSKEDRDKTTHGSMDMDKDKERKRDDKAKHLDGKVRKEKGDVFASPPRVKYKPDNEPCHLAKRARKRKQDDCDNAVKPLKAKKLEREDFVEKKATREIKVGESGKVTKWTFLEHKGPVFTPEYEPLPDKVMFSYDGEHMKLSPAAEEVATFYARMLDKVWATKDIFKENFFKDWQKEMTAEERDKIKYLAKCDFSGMSNHFKAKAKARKVALKEESWKEKHNNKEEHERLQQEYGFCTIDKQKERIYNFRTELPGLFKGLRDHPKTGMLKHRIKPEDCTINCSADSKFPKPPPGTHWKDVCHNNKANWLVSWVDNINGSIKYIYPINSSGVKEEKDRQPIIKAKGEEDCQPIIKDDDTRKEKKRSHKHDGKDTSTKERHRKHKKDKSKRRDRERRHRSSRAHSDSQAGGITLHSTVAV